MRKFWIVLCIALLILVGCGDEQVPPEAETTLPIETEALAPTSYTLIENGACRYAVVRPENGDQVTVDAAQAIYKALAKQCGGKVTLSTDWIKPGTEYDSSAFEILVGLTEHPEAAQALDQVGYNQYGLIPVGNKLCVVGVSPESVKSSADRLVSLINNQTEKGEAGANLTLDAMYLTASNLKGCSFTLPKFDGATFAGTYDCNDNTYKVFFRDVEEAEFTAYMTKLTGEGVTESARRVLGENTFVDAAMGKWKMNISFYPTIGELGIAFSKNLKDAPAIAKEEYTPVQPLLTQTDNCNAGGGMGYLIRLEDSTFIVVDGGMNLEGEGEAYKLYRLMKEQNTRADGKLIVRAWLITHAHNDHYNVLREFCGSYASWVKLETLLFNPMGSLYQAMTETTGGWDVREAATYFAGCTYVKMMAGQVFEYPGCTIEMLYTSDDMYMLESYTTYNDCSAVARISVGGQSFMVLGDIQTKAAPRIAQAWGEYLKSDIVQVAHHGYYGGSVELYDYIRPRIVLWPASVGFFNQHRAIPINSTLLGRDYVEEMILSGNGAMTLALPYTPEK